MNGLTVMPAVELLSMLRRGQISPLELAGEYIQQIDRLNPQLRALVDFDGERVREQARALENSDVEFSTASLPPLAPGWKRDYFFYANGFVKDMDFYEASPFTVADMPFHGMSTYPYPASEHYPQDDQRMQYELEWNDRFDSGRGAQHYGFRYVDTTQ